eukprot:6652046-Alexandrium_andersonii.AAC.1
MPGRPRRRAMPFDKCPQTGQAFFARSTVREAGVSQAAVRTATLGSTRQRGRLVQRGLRPQPCGIESGQA